MKGIVIELVTVLNDFVGRRNPKKVKKKRRMKKVRFRKMMIVFGIPDERKSGGKYQK